VKRIEDLANMVVDDRRRVRAMVLPRNEAEEKYGFRIYQGGVPMTPEIRLLEVEGWDVEACGGTHVANTGEIGGIKIVGVERIQDGVVRLEYVAATRVAEEARRLEEELGAVARVLGGDPGQARQRAESLVERVRAQEEALRRYRRLWLSALVREAEEKGFAAAEAIESDRRVIQELLREATSKAPHAIIAVYYRSGDHYVVEVAAGPEAGVANLGAVVREAASRVGGRGGGSATYASARVPAGRLAEFLAAIAEVARG